MLTDAHKPQRMDYSIIIENQGGATNAFIKENRNSCHHLQIFKELTTLSTLTEHII